MHVIAVWFRGGATRQTPGHPDANNVELSLLARLRTSPQYQSSHVERRTLGAWCLTTRLVGLVGDNHVVRSIVRGCKQQMARSSLSSLDSPSLSDLALLRKKFWTGFILVSLFWSIARTWSHETSSHVDGDANIRRRGRVGVSSQEAEKNGIGTVVELLWSVCMDGASETVPEGRVSILFTRLD